MCDEVGGTCCDACRTRQEMMAGGAGENSPDKLGDTQPVALSLSTGQPKFAAPSGLQEPRDVDLKNKSPDQRKADYVQRQANAATYFQFG
jgi:hypothetical protein